MDIAGCRLGGAGPACGSAISANRCGNRTIGLCDGDDRARPGLVQRQPQFPGAEAEWYARDQQISVAEARKRQAEQVALRPRFEKLLVELRAKEAGNFTAPRIVHQPDWAFELYFKRDPQATLAKYIRHPRFRAAQARYTLDELKALIDPWARRFGDAGIMGGYGLDDTHGSAEFMMNVTEKEYRALVAEEGWGPVPEAIKMGFARGLAIPEIDPKAAPFLRAFANDTRATTIQLEAGFSGRIILKDGCLRMVAHDGKQPLAYFHKETGVGLDPQGYLALIDRRTGKPKGRIGEMFFWAGPNGLRPDMPGLAELKAKCGDGPVEHVGSPESKAAFELRYNRR
jgi:hypothetical protein